MLQILDILIVKFKLTAPPQKKTKWEGCFILDLSIPSMLTVLSPHFIFKMQTSVNANNQGQDGPGLDLEGRACFPNSIRKLSRVQELQTEPVGSGISNRHRWDNGWKTTSRTWSACALVRSTGSNISSLNLNEAPVPTLWQLLGMQLVQRKQCTEKLFFSNGCWIYFLDQYWSWQKLVNQHWDICNEILILKTHDTLIEIRVYTNKKKSSICQQI